MLFKLPDILFHFCHFQKLNNRRVIKKGCAKNEFNFEDSEHEFKAHHQ